jgi:release factor glutamine methyltransferase
MTLADALRLALGQGLDALDAQLLLLSALGRPHQRAWLRAHDTDALPLSAEQAFAALCQRRLAGEPVAYLLGRKEFFGLDLVVDARVLVPRPDTETLVEWALELHGPQPLQVVDLGTGSGAIALALQQARPAWQVWAVDASTQALAVAQLNAQRLGLPIRLQQGNWLEGLEGVEGAEGAEGRFDLIVSNPPYIAQGDVHLPALAHEPQSALVSGADGLDDMRRITEQAVKRLASGGWLLLEHGHDQAGAVQSLLRQAGLVNVQSRADLAGTARCSGGQLPCAGSQNPAWQTPGQPFKP